jgi:hypothetical protein
LIATVTWLNCENEKLLCDATVLLKELLKTGILRREGGRGER